MQKITTVTINGKEQIICRGIDNIGVSHSVGSKMFWDPTDGVIRQFCEESKEYPGELTLNLNQFGKVYFGIKGRWKNTSGWGYTNARHSSGYQFDVYGANYD